MTFRNLLIAGALAALPLGATTALAQETACGLEPGVPFCVSDAGLGQPFETPEELQECGQEIDLYRQAINGYNDCLAEQSANASANGQRAVNRYNCLITGATDCYQRYR